MSAGIEQLNKPWLHIPVEIKVRAFDARLLLACHAVEAGFGVVFGSQRAIVEALAFLPPGIALDKSIAANRGPFLQAVRSMGHQITSIDEEGFVYMDPAVWARQRASDENLEHSAAVFTWGEAQREIFGVHYPRHLDRVIATGNPRIDLLRPEYRALLDPRQESIRGRHGRFIFVPTNCGLYINANGPDFIPKQFAAMGHTETESQKRHLREKIRYTARLFNALLIAIDELSTAFPSVTVVVRPHPAEDHSVWKTLLHAYPNVVVEYEGTIEPYLAAADVVVHNGCSSAIQAVLLGQTVVAYQPVTSDEFDQPLPNSVSHSARTPGELIDAVREALDDPAAATRPAEVDRILSHHLTALEGPLACERMIEAIARLDPTPRPFRFNKPLQAIARSPRRAARALLSKMPGPIRRYERYERQKFPGFRVAEVADAIDRFRRISGRFARATARAIARDLCVIEQGA